MTARQRTLGSESNAFRVAETLSPVGERSATIASIACQAFAAVDEALEPRNGWTR